MVWWTALNCRSISCIPRMHKTYHKYNVGDRITHNQDYNITTTTTSLERYISETKVVLQKNSTPTTKMTMTTATKANDAAIMLTSGASGRINALLSLRAWKAMIMLINALLLLLLLPFRRRRVASGAVTASSSSEKGGCSVVGKEEKQTRLPGAVVVVQRKSAAAAVAVDKEVAARRELAIKRVVNDGVDDDDDTVRDYSLFVTSRGDTMFTQSWTPLSTKVRGLVVILHGLNEHSGRYKDFAKRLNENGYKVYGMDWVGHGGSDGLHAYVHSLDHAVNDMKLFLGKVLAENPGLPCFCFGHSTGAAIILKAVLDSKIKSCISGVVLTSPAVGVQPSHAIFAVLAPVVSFLFPRYQLRAANKMGVAVSRDPKALVEKYSDPLVFTGSIRVRTGYEILRITACLQQNLKKLTVPFLVLHGTADTVTDPEASQKLYQEASSTDKSIKLYEGLLHDLLFEPEREEILKDIIDWLNHRLQC